MPYSSASEGSRLTDNPRILLIDEDAQDRSLAAVVLGRELGEVRVQEIGDASAFALALSRGGIDLVITEYELSWSDGLSILKTVRESRPEVPVLIFTRVKDEEIAVRGMKAGLSDYLVKSSKGFLRLATAVREALDRADQSQLVARSEPWLQTLLDRANIGVFRSTLDERLIEANPAVLRLLGADSMEEVLRLALPTHFIHTRGRPELTQRLGEAGDVQARVVEFTRPNGKKVWLNLTEVLLLDVDGDIVVDVLMNDVSHVKQRDVELQGRVDDLERSNEELKNFASLASHELKEPLRAVRKHTELLAKDLQQQVEGRSRESLEFVVSAAARMQELVDGLLSFSQLNSGWKGFAVCDCNTLVDRAIQSLQPMIEESQATVQREGLPTLLGDPGELEHVFMNLIANALKYRGEELPLVTIQAVQSDGEWIFSVEDNGIGIDTRDAEKVFELFSRLHPEISGSGVGLALCKRIIDRHGGRIWVERRKPRGSRFVFALPIASEDRSSADNRSVAAPAPSKVRDKR